MGGIGNIIWIIIGGAIIGVIARLLLPGRQAIPWWAVIGAGIVGMLVGDVLAQALPGRPVATQVTPSRIGHTAAT